MIAISMLKGTLVLWLKLYISQNFIVFFKKETKVTLKNPALQVSLATEW